MGRHVMVGLVKMWERHCVVRHGPSRHGLIRAVAARLDDGRYTEWCDLAWPG